MNEKKIILTEEQLDVALQFAAMGGAGLLPPNSIKDTLEKLPEEIAQKALSSAMAAGILRKEGSGPAALKVVLKMIADSTEKE